MFSVYCEAHWGGDRADRKSISCFLLLICKTSFSWKTVKKSKLALSLTEVEYHALREAVKLIIWIMNILEELNSPEEHPKVVKEGSKRWSYGVRRGFDK